MNFIKRNLFLSVILTLVGFSLVKEAVALTPEPIQSRFPQWFQQAVFIGDKRSGVQRNSKNAVTRIVHGEVDWNFPATGVGGGAGAAGCNDSTTVTVTGARVGDVCSVSPEYYTVAAGGGGPSLSSDSLFSCTVTADNTVVVRHCGIVGATDPLDAGFLIHVVSNQ